MWRQMNRTLPLLVSINLYNTISSFSHGHVGNIRREGLITLHAYPDLLNQLTKLQLFVFEIMIACRAQIYFFSGESSVHPVVAECRKKYAITTGREMITAFEL